MTPKYAHNLTHQRTPLSDFHQYLGWELQHHDRVTDSLPYYDGTWAEGAD